MAKAKTLTKRKKFLSVKTTSSYKVGEFSTLKGAREAMLEAIAEDDIEIFQGSILLLVRKIGHKKLTDETGLSKTTLQRMSAPNSNPTFKNIGTILRWPGEEVEAA